MKTPLILTRMTATRDAQALREQLGEIAAGVRELQAQHHAPAMASSLASAETAAAGPAAGEVGPVASESDGDTGARAEEQRLRSAPAPNGEAREENPTLPPGWGRPAGSDLQRELQALVAARHWENQATLATLQQLRSMSEQQARIIERMKTEYQDLANRLRLQSQVW